MEDNSNTRFHKDKFVGGFNRHSISFQSSETSSSTTSTSNYGMMYPLHNSIVGSGGAGGVVRNSMPPPPPPPPNYPTMINSNSNVPLAATPPTVGLPISSIPGLNPDVELAVEWSPDEQFKLEEGLVKYGDEPNILKYIKIAALLPEKTVRDVALRCRWMTRKENGKRRKPEEQYAGKKMKDRKDKPESSSQTMALPAPSSNLGAYSLMMQRLDHNDLTSYEAMGSTTRHLLDENFQVFSHITTNLAAFKIQENIDLLCHTRDNIRAIMNDMMAMPGIMSLMPPLRVSINEELASVVLPNTTQAMMFGTPSGIYQNPEPRC